MKNKLIFTFNDYLQKRFGCRVYKVSVDGGFNCPNRDGTKSTQGCIFCDAKGSSSQTNSHLVPIKDQVRENIRVRKSRFKAKKFLVYFQSFTNTYDTCEGLKKRYDKALFADDDIIGISIGTRSDCIDEKKLALISSYRKHFPYVSIEYGLQTVHNKTLHQINRKEYYEDFLHALNLSRKHSIEPVVHIILGLPGETKEDMLKTAETLHDLQIKGVKIHVLSAIENTELAKQYEKQAWSPLSYEEYIPLVCDFIERLPKDCVIYRLAGGGHPQEIITPQWPYKKRHVLSREVQDELIRRETYQGSHFDSLCSTPTHDSFL